MLSGIVMLDIIIILSLIHIYIDGYALFLKDAVIGDKVRAKIIKTKKNYGFARVEEVIDVYKRQELKKTTDVDYILNTFTN